MTLEYVRDLFSAMDPDKPETVNAVLDHMRVSLGKCVCPLCFGAVRKTLVKDVVAWNCLSCSMVVPLLPEGDVSGISPGTRAETALVLRRIWELSRD